MSGCKNNGECVINKKSRTTCKACRLRKCLLVGMSKNGSRYGRRSNWFKIHCLLQEQERSNDEISFNTQLELNCNNYAAYGSTRNLNRLTRLHQGNARQTYQDKTNPCIKSAAEIAATANLSSLATKIPVNFLCGTAFFNSLKQTSQCTVANIGRLEPRSSHTPSDSDASPVEDADNECTNFDLRHRAAKPTNSSNYPTRETVSDESSDRNDCEYQRQQFLKILYSHSERNADTFTQTAVANSPQTLLTKTATINILPALHQHTKCPNDYVQEEPIDLSLKTADKLGT